MLRNRQTRAGGLQPDYGALGNDLPQETPSPEKRGIGISSVSEGAQAHIPIVPLPPGLGSGLFFWLPNQRVVGGRPFKMTASDLRYEIMTL